LAALGFVDLQTHENGKIKMYFFADADYELLDLKLPRKFNVYGEDMVADCLYYLCMCIFLLWFTMLLQFWLLEKDVIDV